MNGEPGIQTFSRPYILDYLPQLPKRAPQSRPTSHGPFCQCATLKGALFKEAAVVATRTPKTQISTTTRDHLSLRQKSRLTPKSCANTNKDRMIHLINISKTEDQALKKTTFARDLLHSCHHARQAVRKRAWKTARVTSEISKSNARSRARTGISASGGIQRQESNRSRFSHQSFCT